MSSGPEHYAEAERLLAKTTGGAVQAAPKGHQAFLIESLIAEAQVHATLALVAATADAAFFRESLTRPAPWAEVTS